ncbi:MAG: hypothetical protein KC649_07710, partial [Candidatus Omnitrophica bacterium]|nr:hypothetical protein [Candidatus Omnitrophota bacterium]
KLYSKNTEMNVYLRNLWYQDIRTDNALLLTDDYAPAENMAQKSLPNTPTQSFQYITRIEPFKHKKTLFQD